MSSLHWVNESFLLTEELTEAVESSETSFTWNIKKMYCVNDWITYTHIHIHFKYILRDLNIVNVQCTLYMVEPSSEEGELQTVCKNTHCEYPNSEESTNHIQLTQNHSCQLQTDLLIEPGSDGKWANSRELDNRKHCLPNSIIKPPIELIYT